MLRTAGGSFEKQLLVLVRGRGLASKQEILLVLAKASPIHD